MLKPRTRLQVLAVKDLAAFVHLAFSNVREYKGMSLELAGDELTGEAMATILSDKLTSAVTFDSHPVMNFAFDEGHYRADIPALKERYPDLLNFRQWVEDRLVQS
jgi:hypothetical protein